jgi:cytochrome c-type biogenesis protein CcmH
MALHRAQLAELDRDLADGQIDASEYANAMLEVQRRLLAVDIWQEDTPAAAAKAPLLITLIAVPAISLALYLTGGSPGMPSIPRDVMAAQPVPEPGQSSELLAKLRAHLATLDPKSDAARAGYIMLGKAEASRGNMMGAAVAWGTALAARFDPTLAAVTAESLTEAAGHVTDASAALFRRALADAPAAAPWRSMVEKRLGEYTTGEGNADPPAASGN